MPSLGKRQITAAPTASHAGEIAWAKSIIHRPREISSIIMRLRSSALVYAAAVTVSW
jgi:hypothetical protein